MSGTILVAGGLFQRGGMGGHAWVFAQYVRGFRSLGFDVVFVDVVDPRAWQPEPAVVELLGGSGAVAVLGPTGESVFGMDRPALLAAARRADLLLNVMGYLRDPDVLAAPRRRVFLDIDPGFGQMWHALGLADVLDGHDAYLTVGGCLSDSEVPSCGREWLPTLPPVHLPDWPFVQPPEGGSLTTVASWRGPFGPIEYGGRTYGLRVHELRRFLDLVPRTGASIELALGIDPADEADRRALLDRGWRLADPLVVAGTPDDYRRYLAASRAELMIAKHLYVATRAGWFSDRSACYLATGRPVLAQDTGFSSFLPVGEGLLAFDDLAGAVDAVADLGERYASHCEAARALAEDRFSTARVLADLLDRVA